jgi:hypothetical protein
MTASRKLYLIGYYLERFESTNGEFELGPYSIRNIINFIMNDSELDEISNEDVDVDFVETYFQLNDIELAECMTDFLVESE